MKVHVISIVTDWLKDNNFFLNLYD